MVWTEEAKAEATGRKRCAEEGDELASDAEYDGAAQPELSERGGGGARQWRAASHRFDRGFEFRVVRH